MRNHFRFTATLLTLGFVAGCLAPPFESACPVPVAATPEEARHAVCSCGSSIITLSFDGLKQRKLDLLIVMDNSHTMAKKQRSIVESLAKLPSLLPDIDYHLGVVTTDVGGWPAPNQPFATPFAGCDSFVGDDGILQATSCLDRAGNSAEAISGCRAVCPDRRFVPIDGSSFLRMRNGISNVPSALEVDSMTGQTYDHGIEYALRCLAMVGDAGCILSSPLEAMKRALGSPRNRDFLRADAALVVILVTDKDDCSVSLSRRDENDPRIRDCALPDANAAFDCFAPRYRCLARSLRCNQPMNTAGDKTGCEERTDSYLESVHSYTEFLTSLKPNGSVAVLGVWPFPGLHGGNTLKVGSPMGMTGSSSLTVASAEVAVCKELSDPSSIGQTQVRLSKLVTELQPPIKRSLMEQSSVCQPENLYQVLVDTFGIRNLFLRTPALLPLSPALLPDGTPACYVGDVPYPGDSQSPQQHFPTCHLDCCEKLLPDRMQNRHFSAETVSACLPEPSDCYCVGANAWNWVEAYPSELQVWRYQNGDTPINTVVSISCRVSDQGCDAS